MSDLSVIDLFSSAAGGWSLGMHRAGFRTVAACEVIPWRRALYAENNPDVRLYDDVCTLTADRLLQDLGALPRVLVGSPPCQDISSANTKGKGVDGERSGLFFEAVRLVGEIRPRWYGLENSPALRTKGADRVIGALAAHGYTCWPCVVGAEDVGADHERKRVWLIGCDPEQIADADGFGCDDRRRRRGLGIDLSVSAGTPLDAAGVGLEGGRSWGRGSQGHVAPPAKGGEHSNPAGVGCSPRPRPSPIEGAADQRLQSSDSPLHREQSSGGVVGLHAGRLDTDWNGGLSGHLRNDHGLSSWVAQSRIAVGGPRGTAAASLLVEAFGDAVLPQIPEAIGRAILRTEAALAAIYGREAA